MEVRPSLQNLAFELYLQIFQDAEPPDLLALGETCGVLKEATSHRTVWEGALKKTCAAYSYFEGSYHFESMRVDELKRAAMGPHLWYRKLSGLARLGGTLHPRCQRVIPAYEMSTRVLPRFEIVHLIPGGRFILAQVAQTISLWDLGSLGEECSQPDRLGTLEMEVGCELLDLFKPEMTDAQTLRLPVRITVGESGGTRYPRMRIYEVGPFPENPTIRPRHELRIDSPSLAISHVKMKGQYIHFLLNFGAEAVVVWDFVNSRLSTVDLGGLASQLSNFDLTLQNGEYLVAARREEVRGYRIPPFEPIETGDNFSLSTHIKAHAGHHFQPSFITHLRTDQIPPRAPGVEWIVQRSCTGETQALYADCVRETRPNGAWGEFPDDSQCTVTASRRRADHLCTTLREITTTPDTKLTYDARASGPLSYATSTEWDTRPSAPARPPCNDCVPMITQDILRRYPKLLYSRTCANGSPVEWIVIDVSGLRAPEARYSPLTFSTSGSRIVGFLADPSYQPEYRDCVVILDY